jgi:hypothetical protein
MLPFSRIVVDTGPRIPLKDLAPVIQHLCMTHWKEAGGCGERLYLRLQPLVLDLDRVSLLAEAMRALLVGGLSPQFSPRHGAMGVHLWSLDRPKQAGVLLIADNGKDLSGEPSRPAIRIARERVEKAGCDLIWQPAHGTVWRIYIPLSRAA